MQASLLHVLRRGLKSMSLPLALSGLITAPAYATPIAVVNGSFEQTLLPVSAEFGSSFAAQQVTGWTTSGYNFVFLPGTADTSGATGQYGNVKLWGPGDGSANGLTASPDGGNYLAMDGAYGVGAVSQTLYGLTPGAATKVSFYLGAAQQYGYTGPTTEQLQVSLGGQTLLTPVVSDLSHGFSGWNQESLTFTATGTSEVLSFLALGTPSGVPPMALLDGVSVDSNVSPVPEPASLALIMTGLLGFGGVLRTHLGKRPGKDAPPTL